MVADAVIYHPTVSHYLRFVATTVGRDKLLRTIQYFSRFYAWYLFRTNGSSVTIKAFETTKRQLSTIRKVMRLGKFVEHLQAAAQAADSRSMDPVLRYCAVGRQLGYAAYLSLDAITVPDVLGIRPSPFAKRIQREAYRAWLTGLVFGTIAGVYTLYRTREQTLALNKNEGEGAVQGKKLEREANAAKLQLVSDLCDLTVPTSALGYANLDDGFVGLAGTLSSLLGLWTVWKKTA